MDPLASSAASVSSSLPPPDWAFDAGDHGYCPLRLLASFALLMAGHGRCVNTGMMLGDREYAVWQLERAGALDDAELGTVVRRLAAWFDDPQAIPVLGIA